MVLGHYMACKPLYIEKVEIWSLTNRLTTKDRATQLLGSRIEALVTQFIPLWPALSQQFFFGSLSKLDFVGMVELIAKI